MMNFLEFFELLNACSPIRALTYLVFTLMVIFMTYTLIFAIVSKFTSEDETTKGVVKDELENNDEHLT